MQKDRVTFGPFEKPTVSAKEAGILSGLGESAARRLLGPETDCPDRLPLDLADGAVDWEGPPPEGCGKPIMAVTLHIPLKRNRLAQPEIYDVRFIAFDHGEQGKTALILTLEDNTLTGKPPRMSVTNAAEAIATEAFRRVGTCQGLSIPGPERVVMVERYRHPEEGFTFDLVRFSRQSPDGVFAGPSWRRLTADGYARLRRGETELSLGSGMELPAPEDELAR
jgi:hypothetical protein